MKRRGLGLAAAALLGASPSYGDDLAFPGADGYGATATGWRGGEIVRVTSLDDDGPGSLRACAENGDAPRICVFAVSGTIVLDRPIMPGSNLYVAGQTAPGGGIQIRIGQSTNAPLILEDVHDIVLRFLKLRPGPSIEPRPNIDALTIEDSERVYVGNVSMAFATDETFNIHVSGGRAVDITLADSLLALSLDKANHPKGRHSKGALICSTEGTGNVCGRISLLRNLFAHHRDRNPDVKGTSVGPVEVINNVFYNPISQFGEVYDLAGDLSLVYAGNVALPGKSTIKETPQALQAFDLSAASIEIAAWDNISPARDGCVGGRQAAILDPVAEAAQVATSATTTAAVLPAQEAFARVLSRAGDVIPDRRPRDALDQRVIDDVSGCRGKVINGVDQVGGWPDIAATEPLADRDQDGLPDSWEGSQSGLDPDQPDLVWSVDPATGLSHVETWLATLAGDLPDGGAAAQ